MFGLLRTISSGSILLLLYLGFWGVVYRFPCGSKQIVDLRPSPNLKPYYVNICAGLASNPHGYPGHAYIAWTETNTDANIEEMETAGYCPRYSKDQIPSMIKPVPGIMVKCTGSSGNGRNLDRLIVICSQQDFQKTKDISRKWNCDNFKVGERDCVTFANTIAKALRLRPVPNTRRYPQDFLRELKRLNSGTVF